jgi:hypothetical protein
MQTVADWQPIETAPRDGTDIIVYRPKFDGTYIPRVGTDYWMTKLLEPTWARSRKDCPPTHWQPFPDPPGREKAFELVPSSLMEAIKCSMGDQYDHCLDCWRQIHDPNYGHSEGREQ